jgi:hypothetical protein
MYLIHYLALMVSGRIFPAHRWASFGLDFILTVSYATICWYGFEQRLLAANSSVRIPAKPARPIPAQALDVSTSIGTNAEGQ